jgi:Mrp family chromosome partitioning ATPase
LSSLKALRLSLSVHPGASRSIEVHEHLHRPSVETGHLVTVEPFVDGSRAVPCYLQLIQRLSAVRASLSGTGVFAGDGVSFVVKSLARELARASGERVLRAPATILGESPCILAPSGAESGTPEHGAVYALEQSGPAPKNWAARRVAENLNETRRHFGWVLIDCPSLRESEVALALAPHTDGVVFVVAADQTKRAEITRAQKSIELSSGALLGCVLNKRTYPVPDFLYQRL